LVDHLIVVEAELQDNKGNFIIDTGSEALILNSVHFDNLYKFNRKQNNGSGVNAVLDQSFEKQIDEFNLNGFKFYDKVSDVINLSHIEKSKKIKILGVIGYSILKDYEIFVVNGKWITDPDNPVREYDGKGHINSVYMVK